MTSAFRHFVERRMAVDLVRGRIEERVLLVRARRGDRARRYHPDRHPFLAAGVDIPRVAQGYLGVRRMQAADMAVRETATRSHEHLPELGRGHQTAASRSPVGSSGTAACFAA